MSDIGIIGGADGPTAILISSGFPYWLIGAGVLALGAVAAVVLIVILTMKNR